MLGVEELVVMPHQGADELEEGVPDLEDVDLNRFLVRVEDWHDDVVDE